LSGEDLRLAITWGPSIEYDTGDSNAVSLDDQGNVVEVHVGSGRLYYRVGTADLTGQRSPEPSGNDKCATASPDFIC